MFRLFVYNANMMQSDMVMCDDNMQAYIVVPLLKL